MLWEIRCQAGEQQGRKPSDGYDCRMLADRCRQADVSHTWSQEPRGTQLTSGPRGCAFNPKTYHHANSPPSELPQVLHLYTADPEPPGTGNSPCLISCP